MTKYGTIALIGSGETSAAGGQTFEMLARELPVPLKAGVLETPAGFEGNSYQVAGRVADYIAQRLQNYRPQVKIIAARKKGSAFSPDQPEIVQPLYDCGLIFLGPGSPTYAVRQLAYSLAWQLTQARHRLGASLALASAASIAAGALALPVYEIYKAGEDPHWKPGLGLFKPFGLSLVIIPHWNNRDGGEELDTSRCFMGQERFAHLLEMLTADITVVGIDEHTSLLISFEQETCKAAGQGAVHLMRGGKQRDFNTGAQFSIRELGNYRPLSDPSAGLPRAVWERAQALARADEPPPPPVPEEIRRLADQRQQARLKNEWALADDLRQQITRLGWMIQDTPSGPVLSQKEQGSSAESG